MSAIQSSVISDKRITGQAKKLAKKLGVAGGQVVVAALKGATQQAMKRYIGDPAIEQITGIVGKELANATIDEGAAETSKILSEQAQALLRRFEQSKTTIRDFKKSLAAFVSSLETPPFFILIDELDRCRPPYAISMLERIKHLFDADGVVFIVATDTGQLQHSINVVYGNNFNSAKYLSRFFNRTYSFEPVGRQQFVENLFSLHPLNEENCRPRLITHRNLFATTYLTITDWRCVISNNALTF